MKPSSDSNSSRIKKSHRIWSPTEVTALQQLLQKKLSMREITKSLARSEKSIRRKCAALGISSATVYQKTAEGKTHHQPS